MRAPRPRRPVLCNETGQEFASSSEAARAMGLNGPNISMHLNGVAGHSHVGGYTFTPIAKAPLHDEEPSLPSSGPSKARPVLCNETKQVFRSINDAARKLGLNAPNITMHVNGNKKHPRVGGYTFTPVTLEF